MTVSCPVVKIISLKKNAASESFYAVAGSKILFKSEGTEGFEAAAAFTHSEGKKWSSTAAVCEDETLMAICDCEKNLYLFELPTFEVVSVPMHLAKTATSVKFTDFPTERTLLVTDKFGDVLRFQMGEEFDRWARESRKDSKSLSIHTKTTIGIKRTAEEAEGETEETEALDVDGSEAHHCTIIGHISMVTDLQSLPLKSLNLIVTADRDEKVRLTRADKPEIIHSFGLAHREFISTLAVCPESKNIYSAGGDNFVAEWQIEGENDENLRLKSKIPIVIEGKDGLVVQEIKLNASGSVLLVHVDKFGLLRFEKETTDGEWKLLETLECAEMTAFDIAKNNGAIVALWSPESGVSFSDPKLASNSAEIFDQISSEEGKGIVDLLSKSKLKKDVERMDWKQKKHANRKKPDSE